MQQLGGAVQPWRRQPWRRLRLGPCIMQGAGRVKKGQKATLRLAYSRPHAPRTRRPHPPRHTSNSVMVMRTKAQKKQSGWSMSPAGSSLPQAAGECGATSRSDGCSAAPQSSASSRSSSKTAATACAAAQPHTAPHAGGAKPVRCIPANAWAAHGRMAAAIECSKTRARAAAAGRATAMRRHAMTGPRHTSCHHACTHNSRVTTAAGGRRGCNGSRCSSWSTATQRQHMQQPASRSALRTHPHERGTQAPSCRLEPMAGCGERHHACQRQETAQAAAWRRRCVQLQQGAPEVHA